MQMIFSSFVLPPELKRAWRKAARAENVSQGQFLREALKERVEKTAVRRETAATEVKRERLTRE